MPDSEPLPLTEEEERAWRTLVRLMVMLPRAIDEDLASRTGVSLTRYVVLMRLSETPGGALRMSDLADAASISPSRMTRVVQSLISEGLVERRASPGDGRAGLATLTDKGLRRLQEVWPEHLAGVRRLVLDHVQPADLAGLERVARQILQAVEQAPGAGTLPHCPDGRSGDPPPDDAPPDDPPPDDPPPDDPPPDDPRPDDARPGDARPDDPRPGDA